MFEWPFQYEKEVVLTLKDFIPKDVEPKVKKRIRDNVKSAKLVGQIETEEIPSVTNEIYRCQVIQCYDIEVLNIKVVPFIAVTYQRLIKNLCILRIHDTVNEVYSLGLKRLSQIEANKIVLTDSHITPVFPVVLPDTAKDAFLNQLAFHNIRNKNNKVAYYLEMYIRFFILSHQKADDEMVKLLESNIWYDSGKTWETYLLIKTLVENQEKMNKLTGNGDKIKMNQTIKNNIDELKNIINGG